MSSQTSFMTSPRSRSASSKRIKLEDEMLSPTYKDLEGVEIHQLEKPDQEDSENSCSICLHSIADRTVIPKCSHEFCFECLLVWTEQSRRCPLCSQVVGEYLIHSIRSRYDYRKHYLPPLRTSPPPFRPAQTNAVLQTTRQRRRREREWGTRESDEADKLERSIAKRRWIYRHDLYAKHVASNAYTKYRPYPTPAQFAASQDLISRTTTFLRRELQIWEGLDVEFLTTLIISLMKSIDIRSESAVKLISEFLDMDAPYIPGGRHVNAEHFAHEVYSYVRSPYKDLFVYDTVVQYDTPAYLPPPADIERSHRWREPPREPSLVRLPNEPSADGCHHSQKRTTSSSSESSERSMSWSPSGRRSFPTRKTGGSGFPRTSVTRGNNQSPRPTWDKRRQNADGGYIERQDHLADASQTPVASSSNERGKETPIFSMERDVKGKRKADEIEMTTALTGEPDSEIVESNLGQTPEKKDDTLDDRARNMNPMKNFRVPRNRTLLDSVKAHLGESAQQYRADRLSTGFQTADLVPSLLTRLSDPPYVLSANSTKARNTSGDCQKSADEPNKDDTWQNGSLAARHTEQNVLHHDIDNSTNTRTFGRPSSSRSQDTIQSGPNYSTTIEKEEEPTTSSKNSYVSTYQSPPISSASPILCQNSVATLTTVESNTMAISSYQCIPSRSPPVSSNSQKQVNHDKPPNQFHNQQISHLQSPLHKSIGAIGQSRQTNPPKPLACSLNSMETRTRLLARLETEKRQVVQRSAMDNNCSPRPLDDGPSWSSSLSISGKSPLLDNGAPLKLHDVLNLASDHLVSEESLKSESKLRARAQLRVRLAAEKRLAG